MRPRMLLTAAAVASAVTVLPITVALAGEPLDPGVDDLEVDGATVQVTVDARGTATVVAPDGVEVTFSYDEDGHVLDVFVVTTVSGRWDVDIDVEEDGWTSVVEPSDEDGQLVADDGGEDSSVGDEDRDDEDGDGQDGAGVNDGGSSDEDSSDEDEDGDDGVETTLDDRRGTSWRWRPAARRADRPDQNAGRGNGNGNG